MDVASNEEIGRTTKSEIFDSSNREELAQYYLKKHKITDLLHNITSALVYWKPEDPCSFIIQHVEKLRASKMVHSNYPGLFDESNIRSLFGIMDPAGKGYINHAQYKSGMENLGIANFERNPDGTDNERITLETFLAVAHKGLLESSATFAK